MTIKEIIAKHLTDNGFDGLVYPGECGCEVDDIAPCGEYCLDCEPGYKIRDKSGEFDFLITTVKPKP